MQNVFEIQTLVALLAILTPVASGLSKRSDGLIIHGGAERKSTMQWDLGSTKAHTHTQLTAAAIYFLQ